MISLLTGSHSSINYICRHAKNHVLFHSSHIRQNQRLLQRNQIFCFLDVQTIRKLMFIFNRSKIYGFCYWKTHLIWEIPLQIFSLLFIYLFFHLNLYQFVKFQYRYNIEIKTKLTQEMRVLFLLVHGLTSSKV